MRLTTNHSASIALSISIILVLLTCTVNAQWKWNPEASTAPFFSGQGKESDKDKGKVQIEVVDTQARLFPQILGAITNSLTGGYRPGGSSSSSSSSSSGGTGSSSGFLPGGSGGGGHGGHGGSGSNGGSNGGTSASCNGANCMCTGSASGACIGQAIASQAIDQGSNAGNAIASNPSIFGNFLQNIVGSGAQTLPAGIGGGIGGIGNGVGGSDREPAVGSCTCVDANSCFLPSKATGNCDGGSRVRCCDTSRGTRTYFPGDDNRISNVRTVTRSQIRRQLFRNIVRGSGSLIDDTLDLILHPFLTRDDQLKVATRLIRDRDSYK